MTRLSPRIATMMFLGVIAVMGLTFLLSTAAGEQSVAWGYIAPSILVVVLLAATAIGLWDLKRSFSGTDPQVHAIAARMVARPEQQDLVARWLRRSRWFRNVGGTAGVLAGFVIGGFGGLILVGLIGLAAGSLAAELHLLRSDSLRGKRSASPRLAGLERRSLRQYWRLPQQGSLLVIGAVAVGLVTAHRFGGVGFGFRSAWAGVACVVVGAAFAIQWRVATRRRPALPESLRSSDDLIRSLAITHGVANPAMSLALACLGQALWVVAPVVAGLSWFAALALYWRFRRLGFDWLLDEPPLARPPVAAAP